MEWPPTADGMWRALQEFVWPCRCVSCGAGANNPLCPLCVHSSVPHTGPRCSRCDDTSTQPLCRRCRGLKAPALRRARGVWRYGGVMQRAVLAGKNNGNEAIWGQLAASMAEDAEARALGQGAQVLVPIPLSARRRWQRGYNPSALLARALGQAWGRPVSHCLRRRASRRPPQSRLGAEARYAGMDDAFRPAWKAVSIVGRTVLLVDDVITTGATLHAAASALYGMGASTVWAVSVARQTIS